MHEKLVLVEREKDKEVVDREIAVTGLCQSEFSRCGAEQWRLDHMLQLLGELGKERLRFGWRFIRQLLDNVEKVGFCRPQEARLIFTVGHGSPCERPSRRRPVPCQDLQPSD